MMNKLIHNITTGEIIVRDLTKEEISELEAEQKRLEVVAEAEKQKAAAKTALLAKLGITEQEAKLLLGGN